MDENTGIITLQSLCPRKGTELKSFETKRLSVHARTDLMYTDFARILHA